MCLIGEAFGEQGLIVNGAVVNIRLVEYLYFYLHILTDTYQIAKCAKKQYFWLCAATGIFSFVLFICHL